MAGLRCDGLLGLSSWWRGHLALCRQGCDRRLLHLPQLCDLDAAEAFVYRHCCGKDSAAFLHALPLCVWKQNQRTSRPERLLQKGRCGLQEDDSEVTPALLSDFRKLRSDLQREGLYRSSKAFYAWKVASTYAILAAAMALLQCAQSSWMSFLLSACLLATFWQQAGWLAHDFLHHQVCTDRRWNRAWGYLIGNLSQVWHHLPLPQRLEQLAHMTWLGLGMQLTPGASLSLQGFSVDWWQSKHNAHHAAPNELEGGSMRALDPDIDTLPFLSWSEEQLEQSSPALRGFLRYQHFYFAPVLLFARIAWAQQSLAHAHAMMVGLPCSVYLPHPECVGSLQATHMEKH